MPTRTRRRLRLIATLLAMTLAVVWIQTIRAGYVNFEASHVHPVALTPSGDRLLAVNTPDALLEVFAVQPDGSLVPESSIPVGLEPVSVRARSDTEAWVVNNLSDTVSIVDLSAGVTGQTLFVGDEPTDVVFVGTRAFVAVSQEDVVKVYNLNNLQVAPGVVPLFGRDVRALAVSNDAFALVPKTGKGRAIAAADLAALDSPSARRIRCGRRPAAWSPWFPPP